MRTENRDLKKLITACLILILAIPAMAEKSEGNKLGRKGKFAQILKELDLSEEQLEKLKGHRKENKGKMRPLREEARNLKDELSKAFLNGASDGEVNSLASRLQANQSKVSEHRISKMIFFKNLLNDKQRKVWHDKRKSWKSKRGHKKGRSRH